MPGRRRRPARVPSPSAPLRSPHVGAACHHTIITHRSITHRIPARRKAPVHERATATYHRSPIRVIDTDEASSETNALAASGVTLSASKRAASSPVIVTAETLVSFSAEIEVVAAKVPNRLLAWHFLTSS